MKHCPFVFKTLLGFLVVFLRVTNSSGAVTALTSPSEISNGGIVRFDGYPDYTVANTLFQDQGFTFTRDDGSGIYLLDWTALARETTSPNSVLATVRVVEPTWVTHLNVISAFPLYAIGAYFGNDQGDPDFSTIRLSVYAAAGNLLGSVEVAVNGNTSVDQFIGIRSDLPFTRVRFENFNDLGEQTRSYSVVIDDLVFASSPPVSDSDRDGVPDDQDQCANTAEGAAVDAHGCSIQQLVPCDGPLSGGRWKNHGHYLSTLGKTIEAFIAQGLITEKEGEGILEAAARGDCGKK